MNMNKTRLGYGVGRFAFVLMLLGCSLSALADGYVTLKKSSSTSKGFAGADWSETVADPSTRDYLVNNNLFFFTTSGETVNARSLTLGEVDGTAGNFYAYYSATFQNEGIIFANGEVYPRASQDTFSGKATFTSPASAPYRFHGTGYRPVGFTIAGNAYSAATAGILAYSQGTNGFHLTFSGDTSAYLGSVVITSEYNSAGVAYGAELRLSGSASTFGGSIVVRDGATFRPQITTSVGSLTLDPGSSLSLVAGNTTGNFAANPLFGDAENGEFRLRHGSPCINSGDWTFLGATMDEVMAQKDLAGTSRLLRSQVDMGCFEFLWPTAVLLR